MIERGGQRVLPFEDAQHIADGMRGRKQRDRGEGRGDHTGRFELLEASPL